MISCAYRVFYSILYVLFKLALERGEKLNALQMKTEEMSIAASAFAKNAHELANKYKNKRLF